MKITKTIWRRRDIYRVFKGYEEWSIHFKNIHKFGVLEHISTEGLGIVVNYVCFFSKANATSYDSAIEMYEYVWNKPYTTGRESQ